MSTNNPESEFLEALEQLLKQRGLYGPDPKSQLPEHKRAKNITPDQIQSIQTMLEGKPHRSRGPKKSF